MVSLFPSLFTFCPLSVPFVRLLSLLCPMCVLVPSLFHSHLLSVFVLYPRCPLLSPVTLCRGTEARLHGAKA